tara:strand:+ start:1645 stop:2316 length:672 start_codon:yes stop_codon:yes gene_type:complete
VLERFLDIKAILFDLDGTLFRTDPELSDAINLMLTDLKMPILEKDKIKNFIGKGVKNLINESLKAASKKDLSVFSKKAEKLFIHHYSAIAGNSQMYDGVENTINYFKSQGILLGCVTNKPEIFTSNLMIQSGLSEFFDVIVSGDTTDRKKPDPLPIQYALDLIKIRPKNTIMVGDSCVDIEAGFAAGTYVVTVPYGYQYQEPIVSDKVDYVLSNFNELTKIIN